MRDSEKAGILRGAGANAQPVLLVGFSARSAALAAANSGMAPIAVDVCRDRDLIAICNQHFSLLDSDWIEQVSGAHHGIPCLLAGGMENRIVQLEKMHAAGLMLGNAPSQMQSMRHLPNWLQWSAEAKVPMPETICDLRDAAKCQLPYWIASEWIWKSRMGVGGLHVRTVSDGETPHEISGRIEQGDYYLQRAAAGDSIGVTFLSSDRGSLVVGAAKSIGKCSQTFLPEHTYRGSLYPFMLPTVTKAKLEHFAELVTNAVGIRGLWQADFLSKDGELALLEINPRWSASMELMEAACNFRLIELHLACILREMNEDAWMRVSPQTEGANKEKQPLLFGKMIAYAPHSFVVTHEQSDRWWNRVWGGEFSSELEKIRYGDIPEAGTTVDAGAPILTCFAAHTSEEALVQKLAAEVETLLSR